MTECLFKEEGMYDVVEKMPKNRFRVYVDGQMPKNQFRVYVDGQWMSEHETREEAEKALEKWIDDNGLSSYFGGFEYEFELGYVCEILTMRVVEMVRRK